MFGGQNMQQMMKQMKKMQAQVQSEQADIANTEYEGKAPDDMVVVKFNGDRKMLDMQIKPELIDPEDPDGLADMILVATNDALKKIDADTEKRMGQFAPKGMGF
ncbi:DNA-binding YbaB/EbfC family protein [Weissella uvarum]|uniref:YbaB/EbfC family nucleoid-associated protein n=1 Tax=Weissella uvarum TaxID=1479233 RepID=UPI001960F308|nr:YbaB/EbfC family nucleoid-associated protein [Weissella uvarum]MBM7616797.1 DNA-binding YbaB/EbfC family protein [Weissella uvarum]MCM0594749.1 YbaB/EbfC family nucleoid-associated protein [Weissella uvarum]